MQLCGFDIGLDRPFFLIAGPCVVESEQLQMDVAGRLKEITAALGIPFIFKSSYDKANRSSGTSFRGPGMDKGLEILAQVRERRSGMSGEPNYAVRVARHDLATETSQLTESGGRFVIPGDSEWPTQLTDLGPSTPFGLFVRGRDLRLAAVRSVAVVGSRAATQYGLHVATDLGADLCGRGWAVVSGGAYGVDAAAHRGALAAGGTTVAVLACGVDVAYPRGQAALLQRIAGGEGVVVSELPPGSTLGQLRDEFVSRVNTNTEREAQFTYQTEELAKLDADRIVRFELKLAID